MAGDPPTYLMNPVIAQMLKARQQADEQFALCARPSSLFSVPVYEDAFVPAKKTREVIDNCDPFIDYEDNFKLAKANGFTKMEEYTPIYALNFGAFDMMPVSSPRHFLLNSV